MPRSRRDLAVLHAISESLNRATDVRQALERTLARVAELLGLQTGWVWLLDPDTDQFYQAATHRLPPYLEDPVRMTGRTCWCLEAFRDGELQARNVDVMECSRLRAGRGAPETSGLRYHASIPLHFQDRPLGIMNITGPSWRELSGDELHLLSSIALQVGIAVERARLAEEERRVARAEERTRLAREIHDTLAQGLTAIALHIEGAMQTLPEGSARARQRLERALEVTRASLEEARQAVMDLRLAPLASQPLPEALAALGRRFTSDSGVPVRLDVALQGPLGPRVEAELFRIVQEALANVQRHAAARHVRVALRAAAGGVTLSVADDGRGFVPAAVAEGHHGLLGMRERARRLGGRLAVRSASGRGTRLTVRVPL